MNIEKLLTWLSLVGAAASLFLGLPPIYFLMGLLFASLYNTRYDIKEEIKRVGVNETAIAENLAVEIKRVLTLEQQIASDLDKKEHS